MCLLLFLDCGGLGKMMGEKVVVKMNVKVATKVV